MCDSCDWEDELHAIQDMIDDGRFRYGHEVLEGVAEWVEENEHITDKQKFAVERVRQGSTRSGP